MQPDLNKFKHKIQIRVRNFDVDSVGIVHNAVYLEYCENGRIEYIRNLGYKLLPGGKIGNAIRVMVKRNEINYYIPAMVDDLIDVYSRISYIKNSSFCFEHILLNPESGLLYCDQKSVQVNLNSETNRPERLGDEYRKAIIGFEGSNVELIE